MQEERESFLRKLVLILVFFSITPIALVVSVSSLISITKSTLDTRSEGVLGATYSVEPGVQIYASLPDDFPTVSGEVVAADARPEIIKQYLDKYNSPMKPYAYYIVSTADKYGLDWKLTTAIAMKESGLGKAMPYDDCNNAWGYGIHSKGTLCFDSWPEGIDAVSLGLKENYLDKGYTTVEEIMTKYAHPDSTTWAEGVNYYMAQLK